jgi:hypothetical protein
MTRWAIFGVVLLGYLAGGAEATDGEAAGRLSLGLVGLIVAAFLLYLALSGAIIALFSRGWRRKGLFPAHHGLSEVASAAASPDEESPNPVKAPRGILGRPHAQDR